ncbi:hypothetical protein JTB14_024010 [Gonioctena quinquepunctata]|nr:hypothetical protein JTB14_024010 [Gonioctena quinquepunctata]
MNKKFLGGHKIECCQSESETNLLEETIEILKSELLIVTEDSIQKTKFIEKLKLENRTFLQEAMKNEEDLNDLMTKQESEIKELKKCIDQMNKNSHMVFEGDKKEAGTQTENIKKVYTEDTATSGRRIPNTQKKRVSKPNAHKLVKQNNSTNGKIVYQEVDKKNNILILGDSNAIDFATILREMCNDEYSVTSFIKHNALLDQILEGVINLTKDYGRKDYVIIMGGLVNMMKGVDAHESVTDILKQISFYTNIIGCLYLCGEIE